MWQLQAVIEAIQVLDPSKIEAEIKSIAEATGGKAQGDSGLSKLCGLYLQTRRFCDDSASFLDKISWEQQRRQAARQQSAGSTKGILSSTSSGLSSSGSLTPPGTLPLTPTDSPRPFASPTIRGSLGAVKIINDYTRPGEHSATPVPSTPGSPTSSPNPSTASTGSLPWDEKPLSPEERGTEGEYKKLQRLQLGGSVIAQDETTSATEEEAIADEGFVVLNPGAGAGQESK